jgi:hypothetical protein
MRSTNRGGGSRSASPSRTCATASRVGRSLSLIVLPTALFPDAQLHQHDPPSVGRGGSSAPGRNRTCDTRFRKPLLYPLSYEGEGPKARACSPFGGSVPSGRFPTVSGRRRSYIPDPHVQGLRERTSGRVGYTGQYPLGRLRSRRHLGLTSQTCPKAVSGVDVRRQRTPGVRTRTGAPRGRRPRARGSNRCRTADLRPPDTCTPDAGSSSGSSLPLLSQMSHPPSSRTRRMGRPPDSFTVSPTLAASTA